MTVPDTIASLRLSVSGWAIEFHGDRREFQAWRRVGGGAVIYAHQEPAGLVALVRAAEGQTLVVAGDPYPPPVSATHPPPVTLAETGTPDGSRSCTRCGSVDVVSVSSCKAKCLRCGLEDGGCS